MQTHTLESIIINQQLYLPITQYRYLPYLDCRPNNYICTLVDITATLCFYESTQVQIPYHTLSTNTIFGLQAKNICTLVDIPATLCLYESTQVVMTASDSKLNVLITWYSRFSWK